MGNKTALFNTAESEQALLERDEDHIRQTALEVKNEELRHSQLITESSVLRFSNLFASLPTPALMTDELVIATLKVNKLKEASCRMIRIQTVLLAV